MENDPSFITRQLQLETDVSAPALTKAMTYKVTDTDFLSTIAATYSIQPETLLFANPDLEDDPHKLKAGMNLIVPPVDGVYYIWQEGDTFEAVAEKFHANVDDIVNFTGNKFEITDPKVETGDAIMIPNGSRELIRWLGPFIYPVEPPTFVVCKPGPTARKFSWPMGTQTIIGNEYGPWHLGIDIPAAEGELVHAVGSGVVIMGQDGWNYGYGNVVQIDHGNGYIAIYANLGEVNVGPCMMVSRDAVIGTIGNSEDTFGSYLHFEVHHNGFSVNPYELVQ
jgi:murein DD-endopeptidase MepM/ murein hydrolase activator NlpD